MNLTRRSLAATAAAALLLTGCGGADATDSVRTEAAAAEPVTNSAEGQTEGSTGDSEGSDDTSSSPGTDLPPRPAPDQCVRVDVPSDGRYTVYDAGQAVVTHDGQRLVLGDVRAAPGWSASIDDREHDEVEVEFRSESGEELDLEVEIDDGWLEAEICADDD